MEAFKMTVEKFGSLENGDYLVSAEVNVAAGRDPFFAEVIEPAGPRRDKQWKRLKTARLDGRPFYVFADEDGYLKMLRGAYRGTEGRERDVDTGPPLIRLALWEDAADRR